MLSFRWLMFLKICMEGLGVEEEDEGLVLKIEVNSIKLG